MAVAGLCFTWGLRACLLLMGWPRIEKKLGVQERRGRTVAVFQRQRAGRMGWARDRGGHLRAAGTVSEAKGLDPGAEVGGVWPYARRLSSQCSVFCDIAIVIIR